MHGNLPSNYIIENTKIVQVFAQSQPPHNGATIILTFQQRWNSFKFLIGQTENPKNQFEHGRYASRSTSAQIRYPYIAAVCLADLPSKSIQVGPPAHQHTLVESHASCWVDRGLDVDKQPFLGEIL